MSWYEPPTDDEPVGVRIKRARKNQNLTQQELADAVGMSRSSIANIELGVQNVTPFNLGEIAKALGIRLYD